MKSFTSRLALFAAALSFVPAALGHGFVRVITIDGKEYKGPEPGSDPGSSIIRMIDTTDPNHLADAGPDLACGKGAAKRTAKLMGQAKPGSDIKFTWDAGDGSPWPHDSGPLITYFARCDGPCSKFDATQGKWFKVDQVGKTENDTNNWVQGELLKGKDYSFKLPDDMPNGDFMMRHEIIALHLADQENGAEYYPSCSQITISGGNDGADGSPTVSFPGGYKENDKGIHINIWDNAKNPYPFPGPPIATFTGGKSTDNGASSNDNSNNGNSSNDNSSNNPSETSSAGPSSTSSADDSNPTDGQTPDPGQGAGSGDNNGDNNGDDDCDDDQNGGGDGDSDDGGNGDGNGNGDGTPTSDSGNGATVTVTVTQTVTVTASPTTKARMIRRSRAHYHPRHQS